MDIFQGKNKSKHGGITHGDTGTRLYRIWKAIKTRCNNPNIQMSHVYYYKGIQYCDEWEHYEPFKKWALENGYKDNLSIDRIDNDGNYEPSNCRWATRIQQANNTSVNVNLTYDNKTLTLSEWGRELNVPIETLSARHTRGYSVEQILGIKPLKFNGKPTIPIIQLSLDGKFIKEYPSIISAKKELKLHHIVSCCKGHRKTCGGYKWMYKEEYYGE